MLCRRASVSLVGNEIGNVETTAVSRSLQSNSFAFLFSMSFFGIYEFAEMACSQRHHPHVQYDYITPVDICSA